MKSIWDRKGDFYWNNLKKEEQDELMEIVEDMRLIYHKHRILRIKQLISKLLAAKAGQRPAFKQHAQTVWHNNPISEWDLKDFAIIAQDVTKEISWEELEKEYAEDKEEIEVALKYIKGIFSNSKIWKGHIDLLRSYKRRLEMGVPLTEKQADTLFKILSRYSKQIVSNRIL